MKRTGIIAVLAAALMAACSSGTAAPGAGSSVPPKDIPRCTEIYVDGKKIESKSFGVACLTAAGDLLTPVPVKLTCEDDRTLVWNDLAWGHVGEPMKLIPEDQASKMPESAVVECVASTPPLGEVTLEEPE